MGSANTFKNVLNLPYISNVELVEHSIEYFKTFNIRMGKEAKVKKRTTKKKRDPNMPKHAMTAFFCFMNTNRDRVKAANPDFTTPDIAKVRVHIQYSGVYILKFVKYFKILWEMGCVHEMASCMGEEITILN